METLIQLIISVRNGDESAFEALCEQYKPLLLSMVHKYAQMCQGKDVSDDMLQEAKMAFYDAIMAYDINQKGTTFGFFAKRCIRNRLVSYVRALNSKKRPNKVESLEEEMVEKAQEQDTPQDTIFADKIISLAKGILSSYEMEILTMYLSGLRAKEISAKKGRSVKSVNNAIYRIKSKLKKRINGDT